MKIKKQQIGLILASLLGGGYIFFLYPKLPEDFPMQFSLSGEVSWTMPKLYGLLSMVGIVGIVVANALMQKEDEKSFLIAIGILALMMGLLTYMAYWM